MRDDHEPSGHAEEPPDRDRQRRPQQPFGRDPLAEDRLGSPLDDNKRSATKDHADQQRESDRVRDPPVFHERQILVDVRQHAEPGGQHRSDNDERERRDVCREHVENDRRVEQQRQSSVAASVHRDQGSLLRYQFSGCKTLPSLMLLDAEKECLRQYSEI